MQAIVLQDCPLLLINNETIGLRLDSGPTAIGVLVYNRGALIWTAYHREEHAVEVLPERRGPVALLRAALEREMPIDKLRLVDYTLGDEHAACEVMRHANALGYAWRIGVPAACTVRDADLVDLLLGAQFGPLPYVVRVALLPRIEDEGVQRVIIDRAHSRHWGEDRPIAMLATAAAYVFAREKGIAVDDTDGLMAIRQHATLATLVGSGNIPWVTTSDPL